VTATGACQGSRFDEHVLAGGPRPANITSATWPGRGAAKAGLKWPGSWRWACPARPRGAAVMKCPAPRGLAREWLGREPCWMPAAGGEPHAQGSRAAVSLSPQPDCQLEPLWMLSSVFKASVPATIHPRSERRTTANLQSRTQQSALSQPSGGSGFPQPDRSKQARP